MPTKSYQSFVLSSPELEIGSTYVVYVGGQSTGASTDGVYSGGAYSPRTQLGSFTVASTVTAVGSGRRTPVF
jgi:hypothetical protein